MKLFSRSLYFLSVLVLSHSAFGADNTPPLTLDMQQYRQDVKVLASDDFGGRAPLSPGEEKTISYLVNAFQRMGLAPAFGDSYTQAVPLAKISIDQQMSLAMGPLTFKNGSEFTARTQQIKDQVSIEDNDVVFVGYGINAPEYHWNDYANVDVRGKTVIILVNDPGFVAKDPDLFTGNAMTYYGRWTYKFEEAGRQGAKAAFIIHETMPAGYGWGVVENSNSTTKFTLVDSHNNLDQVGIMGWLHLNAAKRLLAAANLDYRALVQQASTPGFKAIPLSMKASLTLNNHIERAQSQNVGAMIPGTSAADERVILHAHWDHLGTNRVNGEPVIFNGAVDNASGVAGVLNLAHAFKQQSLVHPFKRSLMFSMFTAEETGLIGAQHFALNPPIPRKNIVAFLSIDGMNVNDGTDYVLQYGNGLSSLEDYLAEAATAQGRHVKPDPRPQNGLFFRSDHFALAQQGVPSLLFMSLGDTDPNFITNKYHKPADDYDPTWTLGGVVQDLELMGNIMTRLADNGDWPYWTSPSDFKNKREASRPHVTQ
jgi:Zn-dependent M28 family amino/carboxypeptidase